MSINAPLRCPACGLDEAYLYQNAQHITARCSRCDTYIRHVRKGEFPGVPVAPQKPAGPLADAPPPQLSFGLFPPKAEKAAQTWKDESEDRLWDAD